MLTFQDSRKVGDNLLWVEVHELDSKIDHIPVSVIGFFVHYKESDGEDWWKDRILIAVGGQGAFVIRQAIKMLDEWKET